MQIVRRSDTAAGFEVLPRRWVVERTFGWLTKHRRLVRDYETRPNHHEAMIYIAAIRTLTRRLAHRTGQQSIPSAASALSQLAGPLGFTERRSSAAMASGPPIAPSSSMAESAPMSSITHRSVSSTAHSAKRPGSGSRASQRNTESAVSCRRNGISARITTST
ncbi:transposase [Nocardia sp. KC 131]|uniref:transposase n=1 Tax=Nocardia arseniciresistens TaxID=3392119 RepID=UPI00398F3407